MIRTILLAAGAVVPLLASQSSLPMIAGKYATVSHLQKKSVAFAKRFEIVEAGSFEEIAKSGAPFQKTLAYVWLAGFYKDETEHDPVAKWALEHNATLKPHIHPMGNDYYYDICNDRLRQKRIDYLVKKVEELSLYGLFFDWANDIFLQEPEFEPIKRDFFATHSVAYSDCINKFLAELKNRGIFIVTNQAFRNPPLLNHTDYDMSESYITTDKTLDKPSIIDGKRFPNTPYTDWYPVGSSIEKTFWHLQRLDKIVQNHTVKKMIYMNYAAPKLLPTKSGYKTASPKEVIHYAFAFAKLFDAWAYTEVPFDRRLEQDEIYFVHIGNPRNGIKKFEGGYIRQFEKGFVIVSDRDLIIHLPTKVYDTFTKRWIEPGSYKIEQSYDTITKSYIPIGRIFLYDQALHQ